MGLHPDTVRRIREFFGAHRCCKCDGAAARYSSGRFYCVAHYRPPKSSVAAGPKARRLAGGPSA